jgi:hypothetical protein
MFVQNPSLLKENGYIDSQCLKFEPSMHVRDYDSYDMKAIKLYWWSFEMKFHRFNEHPERLGKI